MAEPILLILIGWRAFLRDDRQATFVAFQKAMTAAEKLNMRYEQDFVIQLSQRTLGVVPPYLNR